MPEKIFPPQKTIGTTTILPAKPGDLQAILQLMTTTQLPSTGIEEAIEHFWVAREGTEVAGSVGLEVYGTSCLLRSLAVTPARQGSGLGKALVETALSYMETKHFKAAYLLTTTAEKFFRRYGFTAVSRDTVPEEVRQSIEFQSACPATAACMERVFSYSEVKHRGDYSPPSPSSDTECLIREATFDDLPALREIHNQGIIDRIATLDLEPHTMEEKLRWFLRHGPRHPVLVAESNGVVIGWASLNTYNPRKAYQYVADLSVYIERQWRGKGIGRRLLETLLPLGQALEYHKIVLAAFPFNTAGMKLYERLGFRTVGIYREMGLVDGQWTDVIVMEKLWEE